MSEDTEDKMADGHGDEAEKAPAPQAGTQKTARKIKTFSLIKFQRGVSSVFKILTQLLIITSSIVIVVFVKRELSDKSYVIQKINVPPSFESAGYTGQVTANRIFNKLEELIQVENQMQEAGEYLSAVEILDVNVEIVGTGVPIRQSIELFGRALGIPSRKKISGDVTIDGDTAILVLRFTGEKPDRYRIPLNDGMEATMKLLSMKASESILKYTSPYTLARTYLFNDAEGCFRLSRFLRGRYPGNPAMEAISYYANTGGFVTEGKYDLAEMKVKEGLAKFQNDMNLNAAYGSILLWLKKYNESLVQQQKVMSLLKPTTPLGRKLLTYNNLGRAYYLVGKIDSAEYWVKKGLDINKNSRTLYHTMAEIKFIARKDTVAFLDYMESALENGSRTDEFYGILERSEFIHDHRIQRLLKEYKGD